MDKGASLILAEERTEISDDPVSARTLHPGTGTCNAAPAARPLKVSDWLQVPEQKKQQASPER
jgi:hypothetical protein